MNLKKNVIVSLLIVNCLIFNLSAQVTLPNVFSDNMVLQQGLPVNIWGTASPNEAVVVKFQKQTQKTTADATGKWSVALNPLVATKIPQQLIVKGAKNTVIRKNILIGEVWLASGQSNMEYSMNSYTYYAKPQKGDPDYQEKALKSADSRLIRTLFVKQNLNTDTLPTSGWQMVNEKNLAPVSAPGYFFAKILADSLNVPVGLISTSWSGTIIETWQTTGECYKKMVNPLIPYTLKGFLWYQGESNLANGDKPQEYIAKQKELIESWRTAWGNSEMPFYFVQLAPHTYSQKRGLEHVNTWEALPEFWAAQTYFIDHPEKTVPYTGMAVTTDLVDNPADIHPPYKWIVGERLARWALAKDYGKTNLVYCGPKYKNHTVEGNKIVVEFDYVGSGLVTSDGKEPDWFEIGNKKGRFFKAKASIIDRNKIELTSKNMEEPVFVRFAWDEIAMPNLFNSEGLPALPFTVSSAITDTSDIKINSTAGNLISLSFTVKNR
jgi:sialate O-acetylesterase